jgi:hypothetical protein
MCYTRDLDVLRIQYIFSSECQMYPHLVGSTFFLCVRCHNIFGFPLCISFYVSVGLVSRRELGGILCTIISLDILLNSIDVPRGKKHYISAD